MKQIHTLNQIPTNKEFNYFFLILLFFLILRFIIFDFSLTSFYGYDSGIYKDLFESNSEYLLEDKLVQEKWANNKHFFGISYLMHILLQIGFSTEFILSFLLIFFDILLMFSFYIFVKQYFNKDIAKYSLLTYVTLFTTLLPFFYLHYKTIIALIMMFWFLIFLKKKLYFLFIFFGIFLSYFHKTTFFLVGITFFIYFLFNKDKMKNFFSGLTILLSFIILNYNQIYNYILMLIGIVKENSINAIYGGNFISRDFFIEHIIFILPFAILGYIIYLFNEYKNNRNLFSYINIIILILILILSFKFFMYLRFIPYLVFFIIIFFSYFIYHLGKRINLKYVYLIFGLILIINTVYMFNYKQDIDYFITPEKIEDMKLIEINTNNDSVIFVNSKYYLPVLLGWSNREIVSENDFNTLDIDNEIYQRLYSGNIEILNSININKTKYLYVGRIGLANIYNLDYEYSCFNEIILEERFILYEIKC